MSDPARTSAAPEPAESVPAADNPVDTGMDAVVQELGRSGFEGQFRAVPGAEVACATCGQRFPASGVRADHTTRLEGASDPADMAIVIPVACPHCGTAGSLTLKYGPEATEEEADVLLALERTPREGTAGLPTPGVGYKGSDETE